MVGHFHIPGKATRREYAVYVMVARHRTDGGSLLYVGKTGDNRSGCNPVISRAGNHFSFNKLHSQMRNHLSNLPDEYDFDYFYTTFGDYVDPKVSREGINVINEMERQLNRLVQEKIGSVLNPHKGTGNLKRAIREARQALRTADRSRQLEKLVETVRRFIDQGRGATQTGRSG